LLCLGQATRLVEYYQGHDKHYQAVVQLGTATDSYDAVGKVVAHAPIPALNEAQIEEVLAHFRGDILQTPPIYSALKQEGETLYAKARRGETVTVAARPVTIHALTLVAHSANTLTLDVHCSAGSYIRSLAHDLGVALGSVAHLAALRRVAAGGFTLADAHTLTAMEAAAAAGTLRDLLLPLGVGLGLPMLTVDEAMALRLSQGQRVPLEQTADIPGELALARATDGTALGVVRCLGHQANTSLWKAEKWLAVA
jgi:tRNA pseudouridine55 synthase